MFLSKSVLLVLCLNFLVLTVFHYLSLFHSNNKLWKFVYSGWCFFPLVVLYPVMGWFADSRFGRFRSIKYGIWISWFVSILSSLLAIVKHKLGDHLFLSVFDIVFYSTMGIGVGLFQANIIQFGVDQLTDASSADLTSYINWYTWTFFASETVVDMSQKCGKQFQFHFIFTLVPPVCLTLAVLLILFFNKYLIIEPVTPNPLKLIFNVLQYAKKNKYPKQRSAFTYWDDKRYSRIDLGMNKYGGPFSTEEVENVKTFFRILVLIGIMSSFVGMGYTYVALINRAVNAAHKSAWSLACLKTRFILNLGSYLVVVFIPLYEIILRIIRPNFLLSSRSKFFGGIVCLLVNLVIHLILYKVARTDVMIESESSSNHSFCALYAYTDSSYAIDYHYVPIPKLFEGLSKILLFGSTLEFLCAQSPYSMKGILFGMLYASCSVFVVLTYIGFIPFHFEVGNINWADVPMHGCGFWFFVVYLGVSLILTTLFAVMNCTYKKRQRSEALPSEHYFAEGYYDHSVECMHDASS